MKTVNIKTHTLRLTGLIIAALGFLITGHADARLEAPGPYATKAAEVTEYIQKNFWLKKQDLYAKTIEDRSPDHIWGGGVMFSALVAAARHDSQYLRILRKFNDGLDTYWDAKVKIPGYEPSPTGGGGSDKYYDDNAWMVITFIEAYQVTGDSRYLKRANQTLDFVMSGWDDVGGGGIWWHEKHLGNSKNTCANAPAAVGCLRISKYGDPPAAQKRIDDGLKITEWTTATLRGSNGLFGDAINVTTGEKNGGQLTYNSALMLRAYLCNYAITGNDLYLEEARRMGKTADALLDHQTGAYRDLLRWAHLMVEADLELYRWTNEDYLLQRAKTNCDVNYKRWKSQPLKEFIDNASLARELWLMADHETEEGRAFWKKSDRLRR